MELTRLSLQHCRPGVDPEWHTNEQRARAFRDALPVVLGNSYPWDHIKRVEYARMETLDNG